MRETTSARWLAVIGVWLAMGAAAPFAQAEPVSEAVLEDILWRSVTAHPSARTFAAYLEALPDGVRARAARTGSERLANEPYVPPLAYPASTEFADQAQFGYVSAPEFEGVLKWDYSVFNGGGTIVEDLDAYIVHAGQLVRHDNLWLLPGAGVSVNFDTSPMELGNLLVCFHFRAIDHETWLYQVSELKNDGVVFYENLRPSRVERTDRPYPCIAALGL